MKMLWQKRITCLLLVVVGGCASSSVIDPNATPGEVFRQFVREREAYCRSATPDPRDTSCKFLEVKPWSPNRDEENRFAHSLKIPNPVPADSGYRPGMTPDEYFNLLCSKEAGEFIYKTVKDVEGVFELRAREKFGTHTEQHLYEPEDPFGYYADGLPGEPEGFYVGQVFGRYTFYERPAGESRIRKDQLRYYDPSYAVMAPPGAAVERYYGYSGQVRSMKKEFDSRPQARHGIAWRGIVRPQDREMGIAGGELIVLDLETKQVLGVRRNYKQSRGLNWLGARSCRQLAVRNDKAEPIRESTNFEFVSKVLVPKAAVAAKAQ
jgi:hypothetical protein